MISIECRPPENTQALHDAHYAHKHEHTQSHITAQTVHRCECATSVPPSPGTEDTLTLQYDRQGIPSALNPLGNDKSTGGTSTQRPIPGTCSVLLFSTFFFAKRC